MVVDGGLGEIEETEGAAERAREIFGGENLGRRAVGEHGAVDEHDLIAEFGDGAEVVGGNENEPTLVAEFAEQTHDRLLGADIDAGKGLVEEDDAAGLSEGAGHEDAFLLPAGKLADLAVAVIPHADAAQAVLDGGPVGCGRDPQEIHVAVAAHHDDVVHADGKRPVDFFGLRHVGDPTPLLRFADRTAVDFDAAGGRGDEAHEGLEQRGFTRAVDADERADSAAGQPETRVPESGQPVGISDGDIDRGQREWGRKRGGHGKWKLSAAVGSLRRERPARSCRHCSGAGRDRSEPGRRRR